MTTPVHDPDVSANTRPSSDKNDIAIFAESRDGENRSTQEKSLSAEVDLEKGVASAAASTLDDDTSQRTADAEETDSNIVDWDGPDDPENPLNWPDSRKWRLVASLGAVTFITPLASSFFAPGVPQVMATFHERSNIIASLVVSIYILGFALGPLIISPMSEVYGRFYVYHVCNIFFIIFTIACAVSKSMGMLIVFRVLAGAAGSCPVTIGAGTLADIFPPQQRAKAMAIWALGPLFGPAVGPIAGGYLVEAKSWRWVFWIIAIFGGAVAVLLYVSSSETYGPVILERKAARLRKETGNMELRSKLDKGLPPKEVFMRSIVRPMKMLVFSPMVLLMSIYIGVNYAILYLFFTTMTFVFERVYHFSSGSVGLSYLGIGIGSFLGSAFVGIASDRIIVRKQALGKARPEHRLNLTLSVPGAICLPIGVFIYAWTTEKHVHWIVPILGTAFVGIGNISSMMTVTNYLVDAFTVHAASAVAANTVLRSVFGAFLPLAGLDMFASLGLGWGNSLLGFIALALIPVPIFFRFYGERIRTSKRFLVQF